MIARFRVDVEKILVRESEIGERRDLPVELNRGTAIRSCAATLKRALP